MEIKEIVIIAPHFPPSSLPPALRARLLVNHLPSFGYKTTVFTTPSKFREEEDDLFTKELTNQDIEVIEVKSIPYQISRKIKIGDLGLRMIPYLFFKLKKHLLNAPNSFTIYLVPPWYLLLIAPIMRRITKTEYAIDFIDPWVKVIDHKVGMKEHISQWIANSFERSAIKKASFVYSVSEGINTSIQTRYPKLKTKLYSIPYGVELGDFDQIKGQYEALESANDNVIFRYIGAVWPASMQVLHSVLQAFDGVQETNGNLKVEFIGTTYAGKDLVENQMDIFLHANRRKDFISESPQRIPYGQALAMYTSADALFLFGDMGSQYAASKLMPIIASGTPFFAFLNKKTAPYKLLKTLKYPYLVGYSEEKHELPETRENKLIEVMQSLINNLDNFVPLDMSNALLEEQTAKGMTRKVVNALKKTER